MERINFKASYLLGLLLIILSISPFPLRSEEANMLKNSTDKINLNLTDNPTPDLPSMGEMGIKMFYSLTIVLLLAGITVFLIRKFFPQTLSMKDNGLKLVKIVEKTTISPKQAIYLVWAVDRILVLGVGNGGMNLLTEIKDPNVLEEKIPDDFSDSLTRAKLNFSEIYNA